MNTVLTSKPLLLLAMATTIAASSCSSGSKASRNPAQIVDGGEVGDRGDEGCLKAYHSNAVQTVMNRKTARKETLIAGLKIASVVMIPVGVTLTCLATAGVGPVGLTLASLLGGTATIGTMASAIDSKYLDPGMTSYVSTLSTLEKAQYVIDWAHSVDGETYDYLGPALLRKEIGKRTDRLMEHDLTAYIDSINEDKRLKRVMIRTWLNQNSPKYAAAAAAEIRTKIKEASLKKVFCAPHEMPANLKEIKAELDL